MLLKAIEVLPASVDADVCRKRPVALLAGEHVLRRLVQRGARVSRYTLVGEWRFLHCEEVVIVRGGLLVQDQVKSPIFYTYRI